MTNDPADEALLIALAKRKAGRAIKAMDAVFSQAGFDPYDRDHGREIARLARAIGCRSDDFAGDVTSITVAVLSRFAVPHNPAEVRATVGCHLARP